jgi:predicted NodU family carbamoyl transferase
MDSSLLLTLGHNSSAILVRDGEIICGYEEERLSGVKSDSRFPINAITRCMDFSPDQADVDGVYVTHWDPKGDLSEMKKKYWEPSLLPRFQYLKTHNEEMTHHDTHAYAASWFAHGEQTLKGVNAILVVDGFGNYGENLSLYLQKDDGEPRLVRRVFGYDTSLGLMYQYMTAFLGMKMHEDEYKLLGYEAHIEDGAVDFDLLQDIIHSEVRRYLKGYFGSGLGVGKRDPVVSLDALPGLQMDLIQRWMGFCDQLQIGDPKTRRGRIVFSYIAQSVLEQVIMAITSVVPHDNLIVAGGVFYNVKLNRILAQSVAGRLCVYPLAGDQGNALGLYHFHNPKQLKWPGNLNWGHRPKEIRAELPPGFKIMDDEYQALATAKQAIASSGFVNLIRGSMEFGPRALCHTSTIAKPTMAIVNKINRANGRDTIMPMAPVMGRFQYQERYALTEKIWMSERFMVVALPYQLGYSHDIPGAAHKYRDEATGRPQVTDDQFISSLLSDTDAEVLINTSFNVHGVPIVYDLTEALACHAYQEKTVPDVITIYLRSSL